MSARESSNQLLYYPLTLSSPMTSTQCDCSDRMYCTAVNRPAALSTSLIGLPSMPKTLKTFRYTRSRSSKKHAMLWSTLLYVIPASRRALLPAAIARSSRVSFRDIDEDPAPAMCAIEGAMSIVMDRSFQGGAASVFSSSSTRFIPHSTSCHVSLDAKICRAKRARSSCQHRRSAIPSLPFLVICSARYAISRFLSQPLEG